jgi:protein bicaudal C
MPQNMQSQVPVEMSLEISTQHHSAVLGLRSTNLSTIMRETCTKILFPDAEDPNIASLKKSNVRIIGEIDQVYMARQQLVVSWTCAHRNHKIFYLSH